MGLPINDEKARASLENVSNQKKEISALIRDLLREKQSELDNLLLESQASPLKGLGLDEKLAEDKLKDKEALRGARKWFQRSLLALLSFEILFISYLIISQAIKRLLFTKIQFVLSEWEFAPFINVALIQTCILIRLIVKDLFPGKNTKISS